MMLPVTRKEAQVLGALTEHLTNAEIAARLFVSTRTVESHVSSLLRKFGVGTRRELVRAWLAQGERERERVLPAALEAAAESGSIYGRDRELGQLRELWAKAIAGRTLVAVVTGEAGIGKSRLAAEIAAQVDRGGGQVLLGSCFEGAQTPYQPFLQVIDARQDPPNGDEVPPGIGRDTRVLGRLLAPSRMGPNAGKILDAAAERADLLAALHRYLARVAGVHPLLVIIEDLHWATATTRDAVRHLARAAGRDPMLVVATSRDTPPDATDDLAIFLGDLARQISVHCLRLDGLDRGSVRDLVCAANDGDHVLDPEVIHADTGGNPLLVREMVAGGGRRPRIGSTLQSLLSVRSRRLSAEDNTLLDLASVIGAEFDARLIADAVSTPLPDVLEALDRSEDAGLTISAPDHPGRFAFVHALFRSVRYQSLPPSRRSRFHLQVAQALARRAGDDTLALELARHACAAAPLGDAGAAIEYCSRAGTLAERWLAFDEAATYYRCALDLCNLLDPPSDALRCRMMIRLGEMLIEAGSPEGRAVLERATNDARKLEDPELLASIAWALSQFGLGFLGLFDPFVYSVAEEAIAGVGQQPTVARARLLVVLAAECAASLEHHHRRQTLWREALLVARQLDDSVTLGQVLAAFQWACWEPDNVEERIEATHELAVLGERLELPIFQLLALSSHSWNLLELGDVADAWTAAARVEAMVGDRPMAAPALRIASRRATRLFMAGELDAAEEAAQELLTIGRMMAPVAGFDPIKSYAPHLMVIRFNQGRIGELVPLIQTAVASVTPVVAYQAVLALALARTGDLDSSRDLLLHLTDDGVAPLPRNFQWYTGMVSLADAAELTGERDVAALLSDQLTPYSGRLAHHGTGVSHPVDVALAQLALAREHNEHAERIAGRAIQAARRMQTPIFLGRALIQQAEARLRLGRTEEQIQPLVDEALAIAGRTGARLIDQEAIRFRVVCDDQAADSPFGLPPPAAVTRSVDASTLSPP
jgi:DNA-binding CsgD family transcriptional regulator/tetratricopeptide (TPR) repeat protein